MSHQPVDLDVSNSTHGVLWPCGNIWPSVFSYVQLHLCVVLWSVCERADLLWLNGLMAVFMLLKGYIWRACQMLMLLTWSQLWEREESWLDWGNHFTFVIYDHIELVQLLCFQLYIRLSKYSVFLVLYACCLPFCLCRPGLNPVSTQFSFAVLGININKSAILSSLDIVDLNNKRVRVN